jgi:hypothetical protein
MTENALPSQGRPVKRQALPFALRHGPRICAALFVLVVGATVALVVRASVLPTGMVLLMGGMSLAAPGYGYWWLRRSALLERDGLRLQGTVLDLKVLHGLDHTVITPVVRIEDPPFAGRIVKLPSRARAKAVCPIGSRQMILAHPTDEIFDLDEAKPHLWLLLLVVIVSLTLLLIPAWAEWYMVYGAGRHITLRD